MKLKRVFGWCGVLACALGALTTSAARAEESQSKAAPPVTLPPAALPPLIIRLDLSRVSSALTHGTSVRLDMLDSLLNETLPGVSTRQPLLLAGSLDMARYVLAWPVPTTAQQKYKSNPALLAGRWRALADNRCAVRTDAQLSIQGCGPEDSLLAFGDALATRTGPLRADIAIESELDAWTLWGSSMSDLRSDVPWRVDALLAPAMLSQSTPLRLGVLDIAFAFVTRATTAARDLGRLHLSLGLDAQGSHYMSRVTPKPGSFLVEALQSAGSTAAPKALWQLADTVGSAMFLDSSVLSAFLGPSERARKLLAGAHGKGEAGQLADGILAVSEACLVAHRTLLTFSGTITENASAYRTIALEDPKLACKKALASLLQSYRSADSASGGEARMALVEPGVGVPTGATTVRFGSGNNAVYAALSSGTGYTWLSFGDSLPAVNAAVTAISGARKPHTLGDHPELASLAKGRALVGGLFSDGTLLPTSTNNSTRGTRVPFWFTEQSGSWSVAGRIDQRVLLSQTAAGLLQVLDPHDWKDLGRARRDSLIALLDALCELGNGPSCNSLGIHFGDGTGVPKDTARAQALLDKGCAAGEGMACANSAFFGASETDQLKAFKRSCELKAALGCSWYGRRLTESSKPEDHRAAIAPLTQACDEGVPASCWYLGTAYQEGNGVAKDEERGFELFERSCERGLSTGCVSLGNSVILGKGTKEPPLKAFQSFERACKLDHKTGCFVLGQAYAEGVGCKEDMSAAREQWTIACDAGHAEACRYLANTEPSK